jgi:hypothetical protein
MEISRTFAPQNRAEWRDWLARHWATEPEIWLLSAGRAAGDQLSYLDAVEEAICFGWIDSIEKRVSATQRAQRFSPRKRRSNWTELNKARARRLIDLELMTAAGRATLPDLDAPFVVAPDIAALLQQEPGTWVNFMAFPELYRRVRIGYVEEQRRSPAEFERRLRNFLERTAANQMFGNWNDGGRLS